MNSGDSSSKGLKGAATNSFWARQHRSILSVLLLLLIVGGLYSPSIWYDFVQFDDVRILRDHPELYGQARLSDDFRAIFVDAFPREEPLLVRDFSWVIDSQLFGFGNPLGYHLVNVLLHGLVTALVFGFLLNTTRRYGLALATTLAWAFLAVHTEPVVWIMGRKDILSTLFMLLALYAQTRRLAAVRPGERNVWYVVTILFVFCGLLSKVSVLSFPLVLLLHATFLPYLRGERDSGSALPLNRALAREGIFVLPSLAISLAVYIWYSRILSQFGLFDRGYTSRGLEHLWNLLMINPLVLWVYIKQVILPSNLSLLYTWPTLQSSYAAWQLAAALGTMALAVSAGIWLFRSRKDLFFYYLTFFILMIPYLNLAYIGIWVADRYIYFAALFPLTICVTLAGEALQRHYLPMRITVALVSAMFCVINVSQTFFYRPAWHDGESLWQYHVSLSHPAPEAFGNLASHYYSVALAHRGTPEAENAMRKMAVVIDAGMDEFWPQRNGTPPSKTWQLFFLRSIEQQVNGRLEDALASLQLSDQLRPGFDAINLNMARLYFQLCQTALSSQQKAKYAHEASERFAAYVKFAFRGRIPPPEVQQEQVGIDANYSSSARQPRAVEAR